MGKNDFLTREEFEYRTAAGLEWLKRSFDIKNDRGSSAYYTQLLIGRKFSSVFSFQLSPIVVHSSTPVNTGDDKTIFAMGGGGLGFAHPLLSPGPPGLFHSHHRSRRPIG